MQILRSFNKFSSLAVRYCQRLPAGESLQRYAQTTDFQRALIRVQIAHVARRALHIAAHAKDDSDSRCRGDGSPSHTTVLWTTVLMQKSDPIASALLLVLTYAWTKKVLWALPWKCY